MRLPRSCLILCLTALAFAVTLEARPKRDVLYFKNGDRLTCEIKNLEQGQLTVKAHYVVGTFVIDWNEIERIESPQRFQVDTQGGQILIGTVEMPKPNAQVSVIGKQDSTMVPQSEVVNVWQDDPGILAKLYLKVNYGFSWAKANSNIQSNLDVIAKYTADRWYASSSSNFQFAKQKDVLDTGRTSINNDYTHRLRRKNWYVAGLANFLQNTEQQLDLRTTAGGGIGRWLVHSSKVNFSTLAGAAYTREKFSQDYSGTSQPNNLEALFGLDYSVFTFDRTDFTSSLLVHPSLTDLGRVRIDLNTSYSLSLWGDNLTWSISLYDNFDSRPPTDTAKNDAGISTTFGWKIF